MKIQRFILLAGAAQARFSEVGEVKARFFSDEIEETTTGIPEVVTNVTEAENTTLDDVTEALNVTEAATVLATEATTVTEETETIKLETTAGIIVTLDPFENSTFVFPNVTLPEDDNNGDSGCSSGCIIGAVVGSVLGTMLIAFGLFTCLSTKKEVAPTDVDNSPESSVASSRTNSMSD